MPKTRKKKCKFCGIWFYPVPQSKSRQIQCGTPACAKKRRKYTQAAWHREKAPTYFHNRYINTKACLLKRPGYLQKFRATHSGYVREKGTEEN